MELSRRQFLVGASSLLLLGGCRPAPQEGAEPAASTIPDLFADTPFYIAHRGSGDNWPEHTLTAYAQSVAAGAKALDISVSATSDGVLVCHHDRNLMRLTGQDLEIGATPYSELEPLRNDAREWLGPAAELEPIPRLEEVLEVFARTRVLFVEDKQGTNGPAILELMESYPDARDHFVWKQRATAGKPAGPIKLGYRVWGYFDESDVKEIRSLAPTFDYLGISHLASDDAIAEVVAQGKPVIGWAIHTRAMRDRMLRLGVAGMMSSNIPYVTTATARHSSDRFATGLRAAGDLPWTTDLGWAAQPAIDPQEATVTIGGTGGSSYCMGSMCPIPESDSIIDFQMRWPEALPGKREHAGIAFSQADDSPYRVHSPSDVGGYHMVLRTSGAMDVFRRKPGDSSGTQILSVPTDPPRAGTWMRFRVVVNRASISVARTDGPGWRGVVLDNTYRGGYFSLTKNYSGRPAVQFRAISVS